MKRCIIVFAMLLSSVMAAHADELVFRGTLGLVTYVKKNIHLMDTLVVGSVSYLRYSALEGTVQVPLTDVIEIRFIPYDITELSVLQAISDTVAIPLQVPALMALPNSVTVSSISALKAALLDNTVDEIVVTNGTYIVAPAGNQAANSLWIGPAFASRTRPITVRAQTRGAVTFSGNGANWFGGMTFVGGAHDQTWDGFNFTNGNPTSTGVITIGGYVDTPDLAAPTHDITLRYFNFFGLWGSSKVATDPCLDHPVYFGASKGGAYNYVLEYFSIDDRSTGGLATAFHFYHSDPPNGIYCAHDITIRHAMVRGTQVAIYLAEGTLSNITISDVVIEKPLRFAAYIARAGMTASFTDCVSTGSGVQGFYTDSGLTGITQVNCSWN
jgi:hypothetical protein